MIAQRIIFNMSVILVVAFLQSSVVGMDIGSGHLPVAGCKRTMSQEVITPHPKRQKNNEVSRESKIQSIKTHKMFYQNADQHLLGYDALWYAVCSLCNQTSITPLPQAMRDIQQSLQSLEDIRDSLEVRDEDVENNETLNKKTLRPDYIGILFEIHSLLSGSIFFSGADTLSTMHKLRTLIKISFSDFENQIIVTNPFDSISTFKKNFSSTNQLFVDSIKKFRENWYTQTFIVPVKGKLVTIVMSPEKTGFVFTLYYPTHTSKELFTKEDLKLVCTALRDAYVSDIVESKLENSAESDFFQPSDLVIYIGKSLQQSKRSLDSGYYALWNACCGIMQDQFYNKQNFEEILQTWKQRIKNSRYSDKNIIASWFSTLGNLEHHEIEILIKKLPQRYKANRKKLLIIPSYDYLKEFREGRIIDHRLLSMIENFRRVQNGYSDAIPFDYSESAVFIINVGADLEKDKKNPPHFGVITFSVLTQHLLLGDNKNSCMYVANYLDSLTGNEERESRVKKLIATDLYELFARDDLKGIKSQHVLNDIALKTKKYEQAAQFASELNHTDIDNQTFDSEEALAYCSLIEDYYKALAKNAHLEKSGDYKDAHATQKDIRIYLNGLRDRCGMLHLGKKCPVSFSYLQALTQKAIPDLLSNYDDIQAIKEYMHKNGHVYEVDRLCKLVAHIHYDEQAADITMQSVQHSCIAKGFVRASLKKSDEPKHKLYDGYYALWNALCSLNLNDELRVDNRRACDIFNKYLTEWEDAVKKMRAQESARSLETGGNSNNLTTFLRSDSSDDVQPHELEALISELIKDDVLVSTQSRRDAANNVTVFPSKKIIDELVQEHRPSQELLERISKFRHDGQPQAFIVNIGPDNAVWQSDWIAVILRCLPDMTYEVVFHDSGFVPTEKKSFEKYFNIKKSIQKAVERLFFEEDTALLSGCLQLEVN